MANPEKLALSIPLKQFPVLIGATLLAGACVPMPQGQCTNLATCAPPVPHQLNYDLKVTNVTAGDYNELSPVRVDYDFTVTEFGIVGPIPATVPISICPEFTNPAPLGGECKEIVNPELGRKYHGTLTAISPWAGLNSKVRIVALTTDPSVQEDYGQRLVKASATALLPTAATYRVNFDGFELITTRSTSTDTVWIDLGAMVKSTPPHVSERDDVCTFAGFRWCLNASYFGDVHDSGYRATPDRWVGDFRLTPEKEDELRFWYSVYNLGDHKWEDIARGVGDAFSKVGLVILTAYGGWSGQDGYGKAAGVIDEQIEKLHAAGTAYCDGPLAQDRVVFFNKSVDASNANTLDGMTRADGTEPFAPDYVYFNKDGDFRCDRSGSRYKVRFSITRTSWRNVTSWPE